MKFDIDNCELVFDKTIQVSKGGATLPYITLLKVDNLPFIVNHVKNKMPSKKDLLCIKGSNSVKGYTWENIDKSDYNIIKKGVTSMQKSPCHGIITFSYLFGYCEACGVDLTDYLD